MPYCAHQVEEEGNDNHVKEDESKVKEEEDTVKEEDEEDIVKEEEKEGEGEMFWSGAWSSHKCNAPGISPHSEQCSKFWLCRQLGEELQVRSFSSILLMVLLHCYIVIWSCYSYKTDSGLAHAPLTQQVSMFCF